MVEKIVLRRKRKGNQSTKLYWDNWVSLILWTRAAGGSLFWEAELRVPAPDPSCMYIVKLHLRASSISPFVGISLNY